jgi:hypothetical protein
LIRSAKVRTQSSRNCLHFFCYASHVVNRSLSVFPRAAEAGLCIFLQSHFLVFAGCDCLSSLPLDSLWSFSSVGKHHNTSGFAQFNTPLPSFCFVISYQKFKILV